jgi:hypothetical protein
VSRSHAFEYQVELSYADPFTIHDEICGTVVPQSICQGGGSAGQQFDFWLWCNKTKARRLAGALDAYFGAHGILRRLDDEDGE